MQPEKMLGLQAEWTPIMEGWSDELLAIIVQNGVIPGTREAVNNLSEIAQEFLSTQTDPELIEANQEVLKVLIPAVLALVAAKLKFRHPSLEQPFLRETRFHSVPGVEEIEQQILAVAQAAGQGV